MRLTQDHYWVLLNDDNGEYMRGTFAVPPFGNLLEGLLLFADEESAEDFERVVIGLFAYTPRKLSLEEVEKAAGDGDFCLWRDDQVLSFI